MEYNKSVSNPILVGAIELMKADNSPEHRNLFTNEMLKAEFFLPAQITPEPSMDDKGQVKLTAENKVQFPMLTAPDGKVFFMAFTDKMELKKWKDEEKQHTFAAVFDEYASMILRKDSQAAGFVINPFGSNIVVPKEMIGSVIAARMAAQQNQVKQNQAQQQTDGKVR